MAKRLCPDRIMDMNGSVPLMAEAAMNVIKRVYRPVDVMEVKIKDEDVTKKLRPLYGLREVCIMCCHSYHFTHSNLDFFLMDDLHFHEIFD